MNDDTQKKDKNIESQRQKQVSFQGLFSLGKWGGVSGAVRDYFSEYEDIFKLIGFSVALVGLFLNLK